MTSPPDSPDGPGPSDPRPELEHAVGDLLVQAVRLVRAVRRLDQDVPPAGLRTLSVLDEHGSLTVSRLAEIDRTSQPAASSLVAGLVERGWVERTTDPADRRSRQVVLTDAGRAVLAEARRSGARAVAAHLDPRRTPEVRASAALLRELLVADSPTVSPTVSPEGNL